MFAFLDAIPVSFGPHEGDVWMIVATLLAAITSFVVAVVAAKNAARATTIAKEASDRENKYRMLEAQRQKDADRASVAFAMTKYVFALVSSQKEIQSGIPIEVYAPTKGNLDALKFGALSAISLTLELEDPAPFGQWFTECTENLRARIRTNAEALKPEEYEQALLSYIRAWARRSVAVEELPDPSLLVR